MVKCSEKPGKEKDFGDNEENYSVSKAFLDGWGVVSLKSTFSDDVSPSLIYCEYICC